MTICCSNPTTPPSYTVCFPDQQTIPNGSTQANPFYDFVNLVSYWTYTIEIDPGGPEIKDLSHWVLQICPDPAITVNSFQVDISTDGGLTFFPISEIEVLAVDPPTGVQDVLKIDRGQNKGTTIIYRIAIINSNFFNLAPEPGTIAIKAGTGTFIFDENTCLHALPTPSVDCVKVHIPPPVELTLTKRCPKHTTVIYSVGDTVTINLEIENPGNANFTNVTVLDKVNIPPGVTIGNIVTDPPATLTPAQVTYTNQDILITWSGLTIPPGVTSLAFQFTLLAAPPVATLITDLDAGIGSLSGTGQYTCVFGVIQEVVSTVLNCNLDLCLVVLSKRRVDLLLPSYGFCVPAPCVTLPGLCPSTPPAQCLFETAGDETVKCGQIINNSKALEQQGVAAAQIQPGLCPPEGCPDPTRIECINIDKVYDSCFQIENVSRNTTVPFAQLEPGQIVQCSPIAGGISCDIINETIITDGFVTLTLIFYVPVIFIDPNNNSVTVLRIFSIVKNVTLCAPAGTIIDCFNSRVLSCVCVVNS